MFLPQSSLQHIPRELRTERVSVHSNANTAEVTDAITNGTYQIWTFGASSPVALQLYLIKELKGKLHIWELARYDGFWTEMPHIPSLPIGALSWPWFLRRIRSAMI